MTPRVLALIWLGSVAYTAVVVGEAVLFPALLGNVLGAIVALVAALGPVVAATFLAIRG